MKIEYTPGVMPGAKIDLSKFKTLPRPETYRGALTEKLAAISRSVNEEYGQKFLSADGRILAAGDEAEADDAKALKLEEQWAEKAGLNLEAWRENKEKAPGTVAEMAITVSLNKVLGSDFIVARAADYDDYYHGIDNVIIDKNTGIVICGFDEVVDDMQGYYSEPNKKNKMKHLAEDGGATIKYGATIKEGQLVRASFENVPAFYVSLSSSELSRLAEDIKNNSETVTGGEEKIFNKLLASLKEQSLKLTNDPKLADEAETAILNLQAAFDKKKNN